MCGKVFLETKEGTVSQLPFLLLMLEKNKCHFRNRRCQKLKKILKFSEYTILPKYGDIFLFLTQIIAKFQTFISEKQIKKSGNSENPVTGPLYNSKIA